VDRATRRDRKKRNVVEIIFEIINIEGAPAAVPASACPRSIRGRERSRYRIHDRERRAGARSKAMTNDRGVVEVGIIVIVVLEGPSRRGERRAASRPSRPCDPRSAWGNSQFQPPAWPPALLRRRPSNIAWHASEVSHTGETQGLAIGLVLADDQKPRKRRSCQRAGADNRRACRVCHTSSRHSPSAERSRPIRLQPLIRSSMNATALSIAAGPQLSGKQRLDQPQKCCPAPENSRNQLQL